MSRPIEELRAQRELIRRHLNWLDTQIQQAENDESGFPAAPIDKLPNAATQEHDLLKETAYKPVQPNVKADSESLIETDIAKPSSASDIKNAQIGCFVLFAAATLLFLFLLFGLPYLLD